MYVHHSLGFDTARPWTFNCWFASTHTHSTYLQRRACHRQLCLSVPIGSAWPPPHREPPPRGCSFHRRALRPHELGGCSHEQGECRRQAQHQQPQWEDRRRWWHESCAKDVREIREEKVEAAVASERVCLGRPRTRREVVEGARISHLAVAVVETAHSGHAAHDAADGREAEAIERLREQCGGGQTRQKRSSLQRALAIHQGHMGEVVIAEGVFRSRSSASPARDPPG